MGGGGRRRQKARGGGQRWPGGGRQRAGEPQHRVADILARSSLHAMIVGRFDRCREESIGCDDLEVLYYGRPRPSPNICQLVLLK